MHHVAPLLVFLLFLAPGLRLLVLAARTRQAPELWCGLYFLGASFGISLRMLGASIVLEEPALAHTVNAIGHVGLAGGVIAMAIFTQRVFHPGSAGARVFAAVVSLGVVATTAWTFAGGFVIVENPIAILSANLFRIVPTAWTFRESFVYWRSMKKRASLGLADPVVTNRFLLWSVWTGGISILPAIALVLRTWIAVAFATGSITMDDAGTIQPIAIGIVRVLFLLIVPVSVVALMLAFFPPAAYVRRLQREPVGAAPSEA